MKKERFSRMKRPQENLNSYSSRAFKEQRLIKTLLLFSIKNLISAGSIGSSHKVRHAIAILGEWRGEFLAAGNDDVCRRLGTPAPTSVWWSIYTRTWCTATFRVSDCRHTVDCMSLALYSCTHSPTRRYIYLYMPTAFTCGLIGKVTRTFPPRIIYVR